MKFNDFPPCKHRFACLQCRNDEKFRENMEKRFGPWSCPEGIIIGTQLEHMPEHIQQKVNMYQDRVNGIGRNPLELKPSLTRPNHIQSRNAFESQPDDRQPKKRNAQTFIDTPMCQQKAVCVDCRNNVQFRTRQEQQFGPWECPEHIPVNTPLEQMPPKIKDLYAQRQNMANIQKEKIESVKTAIQDLEEIIPPQAMKTLDVIRFHLFPDQKTPELCKNKGVAKQIEQVCCGGKKKMVDGFECSVKKEASAKICRSCDAFERI